MNYVITVIVIACRDLCFDQLSSEMYCNYVAV